MSWPIPSALGRRRIRHGLGPSLGFADHSPRAPDEDRHLVVGVEECGDEALTDETADSSDEYVHGGDRFSVRLATVSTAVRPDHHRHRRPPAVVDDADVVGDREQVGLARPLL